MHKLQQCYNNFSAITAIFAAENIAVTLIPYLVSFDRLLQSGDRLLERRLLFLAVLLQRDDPPLKLRVHLLVLPTLEQHVLQLYVPPRELELGRVRALVQPLNWNSMADLGDSVARDHAWTSTLHSIH